MRSNRDLFIDDRWSFLSSPYCRCSHGTQVYNCISAYITDKLGISLYIHHKFKLSEFRKDGFLSECLSRIFPVSYLCLVTLYTLRYMPDPGGKYCTASYSCFCNSFRGNLCLWHQVQSSDPRLEKEEYSGGSWQSWVLWAWYRVTVREWWGEIHHFILLHTHNHGAVRGTDTPPLAHQYSWQKSNISGLTEHYSHMQLFLHFFPVI